MARATLSGLFAAAAGFAGWKIGGWLGRRGRTSAWALLTSPVLAAALVAAAYIVGGYLASAPAPRQNVFNKAGNYDGILTFLLALFSFALHLFVAQLSAFISRRRTTRRTHVVTTPGTATGEGTPTS